MKCNRVLLIAALIAIGAAAKEDLWAALRIFEGKWERAATGNYEASKVMTKL